MFLHDVFNACLYFRKSVVLLIVAVNSSYGVTGDLLARDVYAYQGLIYHSC